MINKNNAVIIAKLRKVIILSKKAKDRHLGHRHSWGPEN